MELRRVLIDITIIGCVLMSCSDRISNKENVEIIDLTNQIHSETLHMSDMVEEIRYIQLETNEECLVGKISDVKIFDNRILIVDMDHDVFLFDTSGMFVNKIGQQGRGPEEFFAVFGSFIDNDNKRIGIVDHEKILFFNYNGEFLNSQSLRHRDEGRKSGLFEYPGNLVYHDGKLIAANNLSDRFSHYITVCDIKRNMAVEHLHPVSNNRFFFSMSIISRGIYEFNNNLRVTHPLNDTIYNFSDGALMPRYIVKSKYPSVDMEKFNSLNIDNKDELTFVQLPGIFPKENLGIKDVYETNDFLFIRMLQFSEAVLYNKHTKRSINISHLKFGKNRRIFNYLDLSYFYDLYDDALVGVYDYDTIKQALDSKDGYDSDVIARFENRPEEQNPTVVLFKLNIDF
ncbi:MAG: 6-bladed beta-propeller [Marinifilaceae bacterium]